MPGCVLRVSGSTAKVREFLATSKLRPSLVYFKGEAILKNRTPSKTSGFNVPASSAAAATSLSRQCASVIAFITRHRDELRKLKELGLTSLLDFGLYDLATAERPWPTYNLSPKLVSVAGEFGLGIELSFYGK
jgi:hypothetical protein